MKKAFAILTNKYLITGIAFTVWMIYFDQNDWFSQQERKQQLNDAKSNISYLNTEIARMEKEHMAMITDTQKVEQFARESFRMKRDNEDLYVIEKK